VVPPPLPNKCDWEVDPSELDFSSAARIGKVLPRILFISFALCLLHLSGGYRAIYFKTCSLFVSQLFVWFEREKQGRRKNTETDE
jgi:hypothetical protein